MPCPNPVHCGVVEAAPTDGIGPDQWVYLKLYGFSPSAILQVNYCSLKNANPSDRLCAFQGTQLQAIPTATIQTLGDGSINYSFQAQQNVEDPSSQIPCTGIGGQIPGVAGQVFQCLNLDGVTQNPDFKQFYCDQSGNNNCAIVVVDPALGSGNGSITPSSSNSSSSKFANCFRSMISLAMIFRSPRAQPFARLKTSVQKSAMTLFWNS